MITTFEPKPQFEHGCHTCVFLGRTTKGSDVYFCVPQGTLVMRYSDDGGDYTTIHNPPEFTNVSTKEGFKRMLWREALPEHAEAWDMMKKAGYTDRDEKYAPAGESFVFGGTA